MKVPLSRKNTISLKRLLSWVIAVHWFCEPLTGQGQPNILWITVEDLSPHLGCYGTAKINTPTLDQLAKEGVRYTNAYATAPVCAVNRTSIITGVYSSTLGAHHMRNEMILPAFIETFPQLLRQAGYYCTNPGKTDYQFISPTKHEIWDDAGPTAHYLDRSEKTQPFFHVVNFTTTHQSKNTGDPGEYDPSTLELPPYYPDTEDTRRHWASYFNNISKVDNQIAEVLQQLDEVGEYENTIVFFYSDHGAGLPRAKWWPYDSGLRIPLIVRIPGKFRVDNQGEPGSVCEELVSCVDLPVTVLNLAGINAPDYMQGRPFLGRRLAEPNAYLFGTRDRQGERYDIQRTVFDGRYIYIRNYEYFRPVYQYIEYGEIHGWNLIMAETRRLYEEGKLDPIQARLLEAPKPIEELYDLSQDPHEISNLAEHKDRKDVLFKLREAHRKWRADTRDLGVLPESMILKEGQKYGSEYSLGLEESSRLRRVWSLLERLHQKSSSELIDMTLDYDPAVRYWGAIGMGNSSDSSDSVLTRMKNLLSDASPLVQIAAARGLLFRRQDSSAINVLRDALSDKEALGLAAVLAVDEVGNHARSLKTDLERVLTNKYTGQVGSRIPQVARRALSTLEDPPVRIHPPNPSRN